MSFLAIVQASYKRATFRAISFITFRAIPFIIKNSYILIFIIYNLTCFVLYMFMSLQNSCI